MQSTNPTVGFAKSAQSHALGLGLQPAAGFSPAEWAKLTPEQRQTALMPRPKNQIRQSCVFDKPEVINEIRKAINEALTSMEHTTQKCLIVGQMLLEAKAQLPHGHFLPWVEKNYPQLEERDGQRWMLGMKNVLKILEGDGAKPPIDIEVSTLLLTPDTNLKGEQLEFKNLFLKKTADKTVKDCYAGGEDPSAILRAHNGRTKGGKGSVDRKDFPTFIGKKLSDLSTHLEHYPKFTAPQLERTELLFKQNLAKWPSPILELLAKHLKEELKTR